MSKLDSCASKRPKPLWKRRYEAWKADRDGATAVEFGLVAFPFFLLVFGLLEICMVFILSTTLEHGVMEAARQIRTGQIQDTGSDKDQFKTLVCGNLFDLMACDNKLYIDVRTFSDFGSASPGSPISGGKVDDSQMQYDPGGPNDIVLVRVFYEWEVITPMLGAPLSNMDGNKRLLQATTAFRNEPFGS